MTIVLLIRHGLTDYVTANRAAGHTPGIHLNAEGQAQARALAQRLKPLPIKAIYCSPLERTTDTAKAMAAAIGLAVQVRPRLIESDAGDWTGLYYKDIQQRDPATWSALQHHPKGTRIPGGETIDEIQARLVAEIEAVRAAHPHEMVAVVSHADPIKAVIAHYLGLDLDHFQQLVISPTSVSVLAMGEHSAALMVMNHCGDLPDLAAKPAQKPAITRIDVPTASLSGDAPLNDRARKGKNMASTVIDMRPVTRVTASAEGVPGHRTFYIQARDSERLLTLLCEKQQVGALAQAIEELLDDLDQKHPDTSPVTPVPEADLELESPLEPLFRIGQLGLGFDQEANAVVVIAYQAPESEDTDPESIAVARIWATRSQMRALSRHATAVVEAGRPLCLLCGEPMDPEGHICPKKNGHKKVDVS